MATRLGKPSIARAIDHLTKFGDTDVFPHLIELVFFQEMKDKIVDEISKLDLDNFIPAQSIETIAPKSRYGFRIVHQLFPLETLLFTSAVIEIGADLENLKSPANQGGPFAYRFSDISESSLFQPDRSFKNWLDWQSAKIEKQDNLTTVILTDIADYYHRINFHRLENTLDSGTPNKGVKKFIEKTIKQIRSRQSFGIPVGGSASRIIAEAVLTDSDSALVAEGYDFSRFIDDFRIFLTEDQSPYAALAFLADQLAASEGLSLNAQKTRVYSIEEFKRHLDRQLPELLDEAGKKAFEALVHAVYFDEVPDPQDVAKLQSLNLLEMLQREVNEDLWDFGRVKTIFRGLRIVLQQDSTNFFIENFHLFMPFVKELVLYFDAITDVTSIDEEKLKEKILIQLKGAGNSVPMMRAWLYELAIRGVISMDAKELAQAKEETLDSRQILIIRGINCDVNFFRRNKTRFDQVRDFEKMPFILGATCLPKDEFETWLSAIKSRMIRPLDGLFCDWAKAKAGKLQDVLDARSELVKD